jgi:hypothetical protein
MLAKGFNGIVAMMLYVGTVLVMNQQSLDVTEMMAQPVVVMDEYLRRNPKWSQAIAGEDRMSWLVADLEEQRQHLAKPTFLLMSPDHKFPSGTRFLPIKRQCRIKDSGKFKVRWVVLGNLDLFDGNRFAPTASRKIIWLMFAVSTLLNLTCQWFDISGAFMAEKPTRDIYVTMDSNIYKLNYSLYGLGDAPRVFNQGLVTHLTTAGYVQSKWDQCFFVKWVNESQYIYLIVHVDDFTAFASDQHIIDEFHRHLQSKYEVTTNVDGVFLGIRRTKMENGDCIFSRPYMLQSIFDRWLPSGLDGHRVPGEPMKASYIKECEGESPPCDKNQFKSLFGALMQLFDVRPGIIWAVSKIAQRQEAPREIDLEALLQVTRYIFATKDMGLRLRAGNKAASATLVRLRGYADCGFAAHRNGRSQYCYGFDIVDGDECDESAPMDVGRKTGIINMKSSMATTVDLCTAECEGSTLVEATKDAIFYNGCLEEMHQKQIQPTPLYNDNKPTLQLATAYSGSHKRVRYMLPKVNWLMEKTKEQVVKFLHLITDKLPVDLGTKLHTGAVFRQKEAAVMG